MPLTNEQYSQVFQKPDAYTPYAAGPKTYAQGRHSPTSGPLDPKSLVGYQQRDMEASMRQRAVANMLRARQQGNFMSSAFLANQGVNAGGGQGGLRGSGGF